jgi:hypothetical protein
MPEYLHIPTLLRKIADQLDSSQGDSAQVEFWPSAIEGQKVPRITGNPSIDFTVAMLGGVKPNTPERDAELAAGDAAWASKEFTGKYHAGEIDDAAAGFVYAYSMTVPGTALANKLYYEAGLFSGHRTAIQEMMSRGEGWRHGKPMNDYEIVAAYPDSEFKRAVLAVTV